MLQKNIWYIYRICIDIIILDNMYKNKYIYIYICINVNIYMHKCVYIYIISRYMFISTSPFPRDSESHKADDSRERSARLVKKRPGWWVVLRITNGFQTLKTIKDAEQTWRQWQPTVGVFLLAQLSYAWSSKKVTRVGGGEPSSVGPLRGVPYSHVFDGTATPEGK